MWILLFLASPSPKDCATVDAANSDIFCSNIITKVFWRDYQDYQMLNLLVFQKDTKIKFVWCSHQLDDCRIGLLWEKDKYWQNAHLRLWLWWTGSAGFSPDFLAHVSFSSFFYIPTQPTPRLLNKEEKSPFSLADGSELGQMFIFLGCGP